jgi:phage terminase small subunit
MKEKLTPKQKAFCEYYLETGNQTEAAIKAGYSRKTARVIGQENLLKPAIKEYLEKRLAEIDAKRIANSNEVLEYLTRVMRGEEKDQFGLDVSIQDRTKAAELLGKRYRLFTDKVQVEGVVPVMIVGEDEIED